jgi:hypothetical protein
MSHTLSWLEMYEIQTEDTMAPTLPMAAAAQHLSQHAKHSMLFPRKV